MKITKDCISSLTRSEDPKLIHFNIVVIESQRKLENYQYENTKTIYPDSDFGYHRYMNIGIQETSAPFICLCNNDLNFHKGWATKILLALSTRPHVLSASPICSPAFIDMGHSVNSGVHYGYNIDKEVAGWCIFIRRKLIDHLGMLDPNFKFWFADNDYANTLWVLKIKHILVSSSIVDHLQHITIGEQSEKRKYNLTFQEQSYFDFKWQSRFNKFWKIIS